MEKRTTYIRNYKVLKKEQIKDVAKGRRSWDRLNRRYKPDEYYKAIGLKEMQLNLKLTKEERALYNAQDIIERCDEWLRANNNSIQLKVQIFKDHPWLKNQKLVKKILAKPGDPEKYNFMQVDI